jgi:hypothetical protein
MKKGLIFLIALLVLLSVTAITFARNTATTSVSITAAGVGGDGEAATDASGIATVDDGIELQYSTGGAHPYAHVAPTWEPVIEQPGPITAGDLYYFNTTGYTGDILVTLYVTNPYELSKNYSYLNMQVNVRSGTSGAWVQSTLANGDAIGTVYLTLVNGKLTFILSGNTYYDISIDSGTYYPVDVDATGGALSPEFYLEIQPL